MGARLTRWLGLVLLLVAVGALLWWWRRPRTPAAAARPGATTPSAPAPGVAPPGGSGAAGPGGGGADRPGARPAARPAPILPPATAEAPTGDGGGAGMLDKETIRTAVRAVTPDIEACWNKLSAAIGNRETGRLVIEFTLEAHDGQGRISKGEIAEGGMDSPLLGSCVTTALARARFPAPSGGGQVVVRYPFVFATEDPTAPPREVRPPRRRR